jgi:hypothetical protein
MDFANFRTGINTPTPSEALEVDGNILITSGNLYTSGNLQYNIGSLTNWWDKIYVQSITADSFVAGNVDGTITQNSQPYITSLGTLTGLAINGNLTVSNQILPTGNIAGTIGNTSLWWNTLYANTIYSAGIYGTILTGDQPNITNLGNITVDSIDISGNIDVNALRAVEVYDNNNRVITEATNISISGDVTGVGTYANIPVSLTNTGIVSGTYGSNLVVTQITFDSKGRATSASNVTLTQVGNIAINDTTISAASDINIASNIANLVVTGSLTANIGNLTNATISGILNATAIYEDDDRVITEDSNIHIKGSAVGYGNISNIYVTLSSTGVTPGTYGAADDEYTDKIPKITVGADGRITNIANVTLTQVANVSFNDTNIYSNSSITISSLNNANIYLNATGTGVVQFSGGDAVGLPAGDSSTRPANPEVGYFRYNTDNDIIEYWDGADWISPGIQPITSQVLSPDGTANSFVLSDNTTAESVLVMINGTLQQPHVSYDVSGNVITFSEVPLTSDVIEVRRIANGATTVTGLALGPTFVELSTGNVNVSGNLIPSANVTYSLGSETNWWKDLYLSGGTIYLGGMAITNNNGVLTSTVNGALTKLQAEDPVDLQDVVTLSYLNSQISGLDATIIQADDSSIQIVDSGTSAGNILITVDGGNIVTVGANKVSIQVPVEITGNISANNFNYANGVSILDAVYSNAAVQSGAIANATTAITTANTAMKGYVDGQLSTANTAMKGYVDAINSTLTANASLQAGNIATIQSSYAQLVGASFSGAISAPSLTLSTTALAISSGGTGATSSSEALNNLFPSGETSGYVLKTSGPGSYYWAASDTGSSGAVGTIISTSRVYKTATSGQTVFTGLGTFTPGTGQLRIYINGVRQFDSAYTETNSSAITLAASVSSGTVILAEIDAYTDYNAYANITYSSPVGTISATNVQDALAELDTEKAALSGATFTGNISVPYITGATTVTGNLTVGGNLNVLGNVTSFNSNNVTIQDALIYLADANGADVLDIGFVSSFTNGGYQHTGLARDATDGTWKLFANVVAEPTTTIDFTNATYSNLKIGQLTSTGVTATGPATVGNLTANNTSITGTMTQDGVVGGIVPVGGIIMWSGNIASIPTRWALCNGSNGTPDLRDRFIVGAGSTYAPGATGGSKDAIVVSHSHSASSTFSGSPLGSHSHSATSTVTDPGHVHNVTSMSNGETGTAKFVNGNDGTAPSGVTVPSATTGITVGTSISSESAGTPSGSVSTTVNTEGSSGTNANLPPYYALAYIMRIS